MPANTTRVKWGSKDVPTESLRLLQMLSAVVRLDPAGNKEDLGFLKNVCGKKVTQQQAQEVFEDVMREREATFGGNPPRALLESSTLSEGSETRPTAMMLKRAMNEGLGPLLSRLIPASGAMQSGLLVLHGGECIRLGGAPILPPYH